MGMKERKPSIGTIRTVTETLSPGSHAHIGFKDTHLCGYTPLETQTLVARQRLKGEVKAKEQLSFGFD